MFSLSEHTRRGLGCLQWGSESRTHCCSPPHAVLGPTSPNRLSPRIRFKTVLSPQSLCHCLPSPKLQKTDANRSFCILTGFSELLLEFPLLLQSEMSSELGTRVFHHPSTSTWSVRRGPRRTVSVSPGDAPSLLQQRHRVSGSVLHNPPSPVLLTFQKASDQVFLNQVKAGKIDGLECQPIY